MTTVRAFFLKISALFFQCPKKGWSDLSPTPSSHAPAFTDVLQYRFAKDFCKLHREAPVPELLFNKDAGSRQLHYIITDDSSLMFQHKEVEEIEKVLNNDFKNISNWLVDAKLSIHFAEDKTKSILFETQRKAKTIKYQNIEIKQIYK